MKKIFSSKKNTYLLILLNFLSYVALSSQCMNSEPVINLDAYEGCLVRFSVRDQTTKEIYVKETMHAPDILNQPQCTQFCDRYNSLVDRKVSELTGNVAEAKNNSGSTNTIKSYGIYNGHTDITEAFGAFDDLLTLRLLQKDTKNLDLGGGKFDYASIYLSQFGIKSHVYDPFGRSQAHNDAVLSLAPFDSVNSNSILNVILDPIERSKHIELAYSRLKFDGLALFKIYEGDKSGVPQESTYQMNKLTEFYVEEVVRIFGSENVKIHPKYNLIVALKKHPRDSSSKRFLMLNHHGAPSSFLLTKNYGFAQDLNIQTILLFYECLLYQLCL